MPDKDGWITWEGVDAVKAFLTDELRSYGCSVPEWTDGMGPYDYVTFTKGTDDYHMFVSRRADNTFGIGIAKYPLLEVICPNQSILYDDNYHTALRVILTPFKP